MSWKILLKAGLPLMVMPFVSLAAIPAFSAPAQNQLELGVSSDRHSILIAGWDDDDDNWDRDRRRDIDRRIEDIQDSRDRRDRRREVRRLRRDYKKLQRHRNRDYDNRHWNVDGNRDWGRDDNRYYRVITPPPPLPSIPPIRLGR